MALTAFRCTRLVAFLFSFVGAGSALADPIIKLRLDMGKGFFVRSVVFAPNGKTLAVACGNDADPGEIRLYSLPGGALLATLKGHSSAVDCLGYSPDGLNLLSGGRDKHCLIWDTATNKRIGSFRGHSDFVCGLSISPDGKHVVTSGFDKKILSWNLKTLSKFGAIITQKELMRQLAHSPNGELLAGGADGRGEETVGTIRVWDTRNNKQVAALKGHKNAVYGLLFTPDLHFLTNPESSACRG